MNGQLFSTLAAKVATQKITKNYEVHMEKYFAVLSLAPSSSLGCFWFCIR